MAAPYLRFASLILAMSAGLVDIHPSQAGAGDPTGTWQTEDGRARVRTEHCGPSNADLCGYAVWLQKPLDEAGAPRLDKFNPDARRQGRPTLGHQMLLGLRRNGEGRYAGKIYNGDNGKAYDVTVWSDQPSELSIKGCMLAVFCGSQTWSRVLDVLPGQLQGATGSPNGPRPDAEWAAKPSAPGLGLQTGDRKR